MKKILGVSLICFMMSVIGSGHWIDDTNTQTNTSGSNTNITGGYIPTTNNNTYQSGSSNDTTNTTTNNIPMIKIQQMVMTLELSLWASGMSISVDLLLGLICLSWYLRWYFYYRFRG